MSRNISANTAKAYITALATAHSIAGPENTAIRPGKLTHLILAGGKNLEITEKTISISMNLSKVKIIGHRIATSKWGPGSKQVIWAAVTIAFFTSARMGKFLSPEDLTFDPYERHVVVDTLGCQRSPAMEGISWAFPFSLIK
jgi:hypothetical protein